MKDEFVDILRDRLSQHEMEEPSVLWQGIERSLDNRDKTKKGIVASRNGFYKAVAGVAAVALVAVVLLTTLGDKDVSTSTVQNLPASEQLDKVKTPQPSHVTTSAQEEQLAAAGQSQVSTQQAGSRNALPVHHGSGKKLAKAEHQAHGNAKRALGDGSIAQEEHLPATAQEEKPGVNNLDEQHAVEEKSSQSPQLAQLAADTITQPADTIIIISNQPAPLLPQLWTIAEPAVKRQRPLEFTLSYNGFLASAGSGISGGMGLDYEEVPGNSDPDIGGSATTDPDDPQEQESALVDEKDQVVPFRIGLEMWYPIGEKWRVGSGVVYTHMTRKVTTTHRQNNEVTRSRETTSASYLGIPLELSRILWNSNRWALYASAGAMMEINLKSKLRNEQSSSVKNYHDRRPQFSAIARLGMQYNVVDMVGIFFEPGAAYYFHNGADNNIYMSHPFKFDINLGLKINLGK